jgi:hypothetical protein
MQRRARIAVLRWLRALTLRTLALFAIAVVASVAFAVIAAEIRRGALDHADRAIELTIHRRGSDRTPCCCRCSRW